VFRMVAVCVVANSVFPVVVSIETSPGDPGRLDVGVRQESGEITVITLSVERSAALRTRHGRDITALAGRPWRPVLAEL